MTLEIYYTFWSIVMWRALVFASVVFVISGTDDFVIDLLYWGTRLLRRKKLREHEEFSYQKLAALPEKRIAIMVACWDESSVVGDMVRHTAPALDYDKFDIFVGVYPNDLATKKEVEKVAKEFHNVHCVVGKMPGPTNKASNLNQVYDYIHQHEKETGKTYDIFLLHDPEDIIHPYSLKLYNYYIPEFEMVQVPIFPLEAPLSRWTYWTYCDEFAELHTKEMVVRSAFSGFVPSAGVGTALSRHAVEVLHERRDEQETGPFASKSLTEDYNAALRLQVEGLRAIFCAQKMYRVRRRKRWWFFGRTVFKVVKEFVATHALFPTRYGASVKQRSRWFYGISLQEWTLHGWPGRLFIRYFLLHDRKTVFTFSAVGLAYLSFVYWFWAQMVPGHVKLRDYLGPNPEIYLLIIIATFYMFERLLQRAIATYRVYGFWPAVFAVPRVVLMNVINFQVFWQSWKTFVWYFKDTRSTKWNKTNNHFPEEYLVRRFQARLGDTLLVHGSITFEQLAKALDEQWRTGRELSEVLLRRKYLTYSQLRKAWAQEYHLRIETLPHPGTQNPSVFKLISEEQYRAMTDLRIFPIREESEKLVCATTHPDFHNMTAVREQLSDIEVEFVLADWQEKDA